MRLGLGLILILCAAMPLCAQPGVGANQRASDTAARKMIPLRTIEDPIIRRMRGFQYVGSDYIADRTVYRLRFIRGPRVVWIEVDAFTGEVTGKSGF